MRGLVRLGTALAAGTLAAGVLAGAASAHGDPASEYLVDHQVFFPIYAPLPQEQQLRLAALVRQANERGFAIRVAVVGTRRDLGTEGDAWLRPQAYAKALDADLAYYFKGRVLVVMPNGFGIAHPRHATGADAAILARIPTSSGLTQAAMLAVKRLAAASSVGISPPAHVTTPAERNRQDRLVIGALAILALASWWVVRLLRRRAGPSALARGRPGRG